MDTWIETGSEVRLQILRGCNCSRQRRLLAFLPTLLVVRHKSAARARGRASPKFCIVVHIQRRIMPSCR